VRVEVGAMRRLDRVAGGAVKLPPPGDLYEAPNPAAIRAAAHRLGVPADTIVEVGEVGPYAAMIAPLYDAGAKAEPLPG
jgi:hypothetical protein